jgi:hypothetical protein
MIALASSGGGLRAVGVRQREAGRAGAGLGPRRGLLSGHSRRGCWARPPGRLCCFTLSKGGPGTGAAAGAWGRGAFTGSVSPRPHPGGASSRAPAGGQGRVSRVMATRPLPLDAGGLPVIGSTTCARIVALLLGWPRHHRPCRPEPRLDGLWSPSLTGPAVDPALDAWPPGPMEARKQAVFRVGQARGRRNESLVGSAQREERRLRSTWSSPVPERRARAVDAMIDTKHGRSAGCAAKRCSGSQRGSARAAAPACLAWSRRP